MRHINAQWRDWETGDDAGGTPPPTPDDAGASFDDGSGQDADGDAAGSADAAPLWSTADDQVLHLPPAGIERIVLGGAGGFPRRRRPRIPRPRRQRVIRALGNIVRSARQIPTAGRPAFRSRVGGRSFRILTRPRSGWRNEIVSIQPEASGRELSEQELYELFEMEMKSDVGEMEIVVPPAAALNIQQFAAQLGKEWSDRRKGNPSPEAMTKWLLKDHQDTLTGARLRWSKGQYSPASISRGWAISRVEQMRFQLAPTAGIRPLVNFAPPPPPVTLVSSPLIGDSKVAPVAPLLVRFVEALKKQYSKPFRASNYRGHGGGAFNGRGFSLDLFLNPKDERGFYPTDESIRYLRAVHKAAKAVGAEWRVLYNDFAVADALNRETGVRHVGFMGGLRYKDKNKTQVSGLNWHGPHPLILHFHLDLAPAKGTTTGVSREMPSTRRTTPPAVDHTAADALRIAKRAVPGLPGTTIEQLVETWRARICPEIPLQILLAFIKYESGGKFDDATHGTQKNGWTVPAFYELGLFQTPGGLHGRCTGPKWESCQFGPPGREGTTPSTWARLCKRIGANPMDWKNPVTQVRAGLMDLESAASRLRKDYPDLFTRRGSDWDLRMAVLYTFSRGGGYARSFLKPYRQQLAGLPESARWKFLQDKVVTVTGKGGTKIRRAFLGENVEKKMVLAARLGYRAS